MVPDAPMHVTLELPDEYFPPMEADAAARRLKLYTALVLYQAGQLSMGAACDLAEVDRYAFLKACKEHNISAIRYDADDVRGDLQRLREAEE